MKRGVPSTDRLVQSGVTSYDPTARRREREAQRNRVADAMNESRSIREMAANVNSGGQNAQQSVMMMSTMQPTALANSTMMIPAAADGRRGSMASSVSFPRMSTMGASMVVGTAPAQPHPAQIQADSLRDRLQSKTTELSSVRVELAEALEGLRRCEDTAVRDAEAIARLQRELDDKEILIARTSAIAEDSGKSAADAREKSGEAERLARHLQGTIDELKTEVQKRDAVIEEQAAALKEAEADAEFRINIVQESKSQLEHDLEHMQVEMQAMATEIQRLSEHIDDKHDHIDGLQEAMGAKHSEVERTQRVVKEWTDEAERLRGELDNQRRASHVEKQQSSTELKQARTDLHNLQLRVSTLEVDRNNMAASKLDLAQEVVKLKRRYDDKDDQVKKLTRALEQKEQQLAEIGVSAKRASIDEAASRRRSSVAAKSVKARSSFSVNGKWTQ